MGHSWFEWVGHLWLKWVGQLWQSGLFFGGGGGGGDVLENTGLQGSILSGSLMTMGFGPFELPTRGLLQRGWDHSPPKVCFEEPSCWLAFTVL